MPVPTPVSKRTLMLISMPVEVCNESHGNASVDAVVPGQVQCWDSVLKGTGHELTGPLQLWEGSKQRRVWWWWWWWLVVWGGVVELAEQ